MTTVNQPLPIEADATEFDAFDAATNAQVRTFDLFGMVEINAWNCSFEKGTKGPIPFDPENPNHKRFTAIDVFIQPLPEIDVRYPKSLECHWTAESYTWTKITKPSIFEAFERFSGHEIGSVKEINGLYARVARVDSLDKKYEKKDSNGNLTGEMVTPKTFKFIEFYANEDACRAAYVAAGGQAMGASSAVAPSQEQSDKNAAMAFLPVIVKNALNGKGLKISDDWKAAVNTALAQYPMVVKHFNAESPEVATYALPLLGA